MSQLAKYQEMRARMVLLDAEDEALTGLLDEMDVVWAALSDEERAALDAEVVTPRCVVGDAVAPGVPNIEKLTDGQHKGHVVLCEADRAAGRVRPVRERYKHIKCGGVTTMPLACAETYAKDPGFYGSTFCSHCGGYFPVGAEGEFVWHGTDEKVGT